MSNNRVASLFIVWSFLHLIVWAFAEHLPAAPRYFYPFSGSLFRSYDLTEFLVYVGAPVVIFLSWRLFNK